MEKIRSLEHGLQIIEKTNSMRHASKVAGLLNNKYGTTRENRRSIQEAASAKKQSRQLPDEGRYVRLHRPWDEKY